MTREEAITNLIMISTAFVEPVTIEQRKLINETFNMAIKALEQEPCDDTISREAALNRVAREYTEWDELYIDIAKLPSVTPSRRKGKGELYEGEFGEMESGE